MTNTKPKDEPSDYCSICKRSFASKFSYKRHTDTFHINNVLLLRGRKPIKYKAQSNILPVVDDPNYHCRSCNHKFPFKRTYRSHLITVHKMKLEPLQKSASKLKAQPDILPVVDDPNNNCRSCNYQFSSKTAYRRHLMNAHKMQLAPLRGCVIRLEPQPSIAPVVDDPNYYCRSCNHKFLSKHTYRSHLITVHEMKLEPLGQSLPKLKPQPDISPVVDDPNHYCRSCDYKFARKQTYRRHLMTIHDMRLEPLQKSVPKLQAQPNISPVADDPNHYCRSCDYIFASRQTYRYHLRIIHGMKLEPLQKSAPPKFQVQPNITPIVDDPNHYCRSCDYKFTSRQTYRSHLMTVHEMDLGQLRRSKSQSNIAPIVDDSNHICRSCNFQFANKYSYKGHLKQIHKIKLEPSPRVVASKLNPQPNITPVVDDPNYTCRSCNYRYANKQNYRSHLMTVHEMKLEPIHRVTKVKIQPNIAPIVDNLNHICRSCGDHQFASKQTYRLHLMAVHQMELEPPQRVVEPKRKAQPNRASVVDDPHYYCRPCDHQFSSRSN